MQGNPDPCIDITSGLNEFNHKLFIIDKESGPTSFEVVKAFRSAARVKKAGHAGTVMALDCIKKAGIELKGDLTLISEVDEERGEGNGCLSYLDRGYRADGALFPEQGPDHTDT